MKCIHASLVLKSSFTIPCCTCIFILNLIKIISYFFVPGMHKQAHLTEEEDDGYRDGIR